MAELFDGHVAPGFEGVAETFAAGLKRREEWGAGLCVWHDGAVVVDVWGGAADRKRAEPWAPDTMATVFSVTKGLAALCFLMLADRGELDYDAPVARYWPEFGVDGKETITVRMVLNHASGLIGLAEPIDLDDLEHRPERVAEVLAMSQPRWEPGTDQGYHAITYGLYAQEIFRRITGETLGSFLAREVAGPLGADVYLGLPEELEPRVATTYPATTGERLFQIVPKLLFHRGTEGQVYRQVAMGHDAARAVAHPHELGPRGLHNFNTRRVRAMELPWSNGVASARGLCRVYAALAAGGELDGVRLVSPEAVAGLAERQSWSERDRVLRKPVGWSQGFLKEKAGLFSPTDGAFGHAGAGGALGWCDPEAKLAIGYAPNKMDHRIRSRRAVALCGAIRAAVG